MKILIAIVAAVFVHTLHAADALSDLPTEIKTIISEKGYPSAKGALKVYIDSNPESYSGYSALGKATALEGDYKQSINYFEQAKEIKENKNIPDASIYNSIGWVKFLSGDTQGGIGDIEAAIEKKNDLDPKVAEAALNNLGLIYIYMYNDETEKAKMNFDKAVSEYGSKYAKDNLLLMNNLEKNRERQANGADTSNPQ
jgi:tetratricopeptide (TPR) repeat protein